MQARVTGFGWHISPEAPDDADTPDDPRLTRLRVTSGLSSPASSTPVHQYDKYSAHSSAYSEIAPLVASPVAEASAHYIGVGPTRYHSLLHGSVLGVPISGVLTAADDRPPSGDVSTAIGLDLDDVTAALATPGFGASAAQRQSAERLMAAFTSGMLARIATPDGVRDIEEREHADGFWSFAGAPLAKATDDRLRAEDSLPFNPTTVGRKGRGALAGSSKSTKGGKGATVDEPLETEVAWEDKYSDKYVRVGSGSTKRSKRARAAGSAAARPNNVGQSRTVAKPAPRMFRPAPPVVAVRGVKPNARHHGDGLFDPLGLRCRWPGECQPGFQGVLDPAQILPTLGNGAIPTEVLTVVREAVTLDPYSGQWLARAGQPEAQWKAREGRIAAEHIRLYGASMTYDGSGATGLLKAIKGPRAAASSWSDVSVSSVDSATQLSVELAGYSYVAGATPSPVALNPWRQPWVPLYVEWKVRVHGGETLDGWSLDGLDLVARADQADPPETVRSDVHWAQPDHHRDRQVARDGDDSVADRRERTRRGDAQPVPAQRGRRGVVRQVARPPRPARSRARRRSTGSASSCWASTTSRVRSCAQIPDGDPTGAPRPVASGLPTVLFGGTIEVLGLRAVDAFGRTLDDPGRLDADDRHARGRRLAGNDRSAPTAPTRRAVAVPPRRSQPTPDGRPGRGGGGVRRPAGRRRRRSPRSPASCCPTTWTSRSSSSTHRQPASVSLSHDAVSDAVDVGARPRPRGAARRGAARPGIPGEFGRPRAARRRCSPPG